MYAFAAGANAHQLLHLLQDGVALSRSQDRLLSESKANQSYKKSKGEPFMLWIRFISSR
jgi:hypothetical protein